MIKYIPSIIITNSFNQTVKKEKEYQKMLLNLGGNK